VEVSGGQDQINKTILQEDVNNTCPETLPLSVKWFLFKCLLARSLFNFLIQLYYALLVFYPNDYVMLKN